MGGPKFRAFFLLLPSEISLFLLSLSWGLHVHPQRCKFFFFGTRVNGRTLNVMWASICPSRPVSWNMRSPRPPRARGNVATSCVGHLWRGQLGGFCSDTPTTDLKSSWLADAQCTNKSHAPCMSFTRGILSSNSCCSAAKSTRCLRTKSGCPRGVPKIFIPCCSVAMPDPRHPGRGIDHSSQSAPTRLPDAFHTLVLPSCMEIRHGAAMLLRLQRRPLQPCSVLNRNKCRPKMPSPSHHHGDSCCVLSTEKSNGIMGSPCSPLLGEWSAPRRRSPPTDTLLGRLNCRIY